jgi:hypothetical protein
MAAQHYLIGCDQGGPVGDGGGGDGAIHRVGVEVSQLRGCRARGLGNHDQLKRAHGCRAGSLQGLPGAVDWCEQITMELRHGLPVDWGSHGTQGKFT